MFSITPQLKSKIIEKDLINNRLRNVDLKIINKKNEIENLKGKYFHDVLPILENLGFNVEHKGKGLIIKTFKIVNNSKNKKIILELSWSS